MTKLLASLLAVAALAHAQDLPVAKTSIDMMPGLEQPQRAALYRVWYGVAGRLKGAKGAQVKALHAELLQKLRAAGLDDAQMARLQAMPRGALREERYNHGVVLEAPDLSARQRTLLLRCVTAADSAQRVLQAQLKHLDPGLKKVEVAMRRQVQSSFRQQHQLIEKRFWRAVYYALEPAQMRAVRALLSPRYGYVPEVEQQLYLLPGVTPSQATRIHALFVEHNSETTADNAEVNTLRMRLRDRKLKKEDRDALQRRMNEANQRLNALRLGLREALKAVLTQEQVDAFHALTPMLTVGDRRQGLRPTLDEMRLSAEQQARVAVLRREAEQEVKKVRAALNEEMGEMMGAGLGPESPQSMTMQTMQRGATSKNLALVRKIGREIVVDVLEPAQVSNWIVAPVVRS